MPDTKTKCIFSKDAAKIAVITLLKGIKCRTAVFNADNNNLELKNSSIIAQFLKTDNNRRKMTKKLAYSLSNTFKYYILSSGTEYKDVYKSNYLYICSQ